MLIFVMDKCVLFEVWTEFLIIIDIFGLNKHENIFLLFSDYGKSHVHTQFTDLKET
jgi:hypothetical protein